MNTQRIKSYAPKARTDFIAVLSKQAAKYGITSDRVQPVEVKGDVALIDGRPFPVAIIKPRAALVQLIQQQGFAVVIEQVAYSWFNRLCAIRYMELHDYLGHGRRVLSHPDQAGGLQILDECLDIDLPGLDNSRVHQLKLDGNKDEQLYRELLLVQCHALHQAMPFLFEPLDDETELLLPDNLTKTDSLIRDLVDSIPEQDWQNIEIIGWLYQFYISEKKDQVIGKVVKSEDIPAATQLFTPNWIVKYMVQNSLGAQWLATYPDSPLKAQMDYYIEPAEQTDEVNQQLKAITPTALNPEELTLIDPASGSGHILVEAYELFKAIYLERGYRQRDIPQLILEKNLFGLDIDPRAAQLTGFALMMKGRADDRRLFERGVKLNVMALQDSTGFDVEGLANGLKLADYGLKPEDLTELTELFEHATTFGSLIQVPEALAKKLPALKQLSEATRQDLFVSEALKRLGPLVKQVERLAAQYDAVVANPPYMGRRSGMNSLIKEFTAEVYPITKFDLYACFVDRGFSLVKEGGHNAMVTMQSWLFLSSFEGMRDFVLQRKTIKTLAHLGARAFGSISGEVVQTTVFAIQNANFCAYRPAFFRLVDGGENQKRTTLVNGEGRFDRVSQVKFEQIPTSPFAYWCSDPVFAAFGQPKLAAIAEGKQGMATSDNNRFLRYWHEVPISSVLFDCSDASMAEGRSEKWYPYCKGGSFRRWRGNNEYLVNWQRNGKELKAFVEEINKLRPGGRLKNQEYYFLENITYSALSSGPFSVRHNPPGFLFDTKGSCVFASDSELRLLLGYLNSKVAQEFLDILCPTLDYSSIGVNALPIVCPPKFAGVDQLVSMAEADWNSFERSWDFQSLPILTTTDSTPTPTPESSYTAWITQNRDTIAEMKRLEEENNRLFIDAYGLQDELTPDVPIEQITLTVNPAYRYGGKLPEDELWTRFRQDSMEELVSYAIGCMMGRYSLDEPGLVYAHSGNEGFDPSRYTTYPADDDGIIPLTDTEWFEDDVCNRLIEFMALAWDAASLEDNLAFLADNLSPKKSESSRDTLRRYLNDKFFKDHLKTYKKRPIYWLFSSGKQKAFQCLVYLHRYNEGSLARMRTEYVIPLTAKLTTHVQKLEQDKDASTSTAEIKKLEKQIARLHKQQTELSSFDEKLRHHADQRITLDLDDGVKVNYGKFGDLLAEVKAVHGKTPEIRI